MTIWRGRIKWEPVSHCICWDAIYWIQKVLKISTTVVALLRNRSTTAQSIRLTRAWRSWLQICYSLCTILFLLNLVSFALSVYSISFYIVGRILNLLSFQILLHDYVLWLFLFLAFTPKLVHDNVLLFPYAPSNRNFYWYIAVEIQDALSIYLWAGSAILFLFGKVIAW